MLAIVTVRTGSNFLHWQTSPERSQGWRVLHLVVDYLWIGALSLVVIYAERVLLDLWVAHSPLSLRIPLVSGDKRHA